MEGCLLPQRLPGAPMCPFPRLRLRRRPLPRRLPGAPVCPPWQLRSTGRLRSRLVWCPLCRLWGTAAEAAQEGGAAVAVAAALAVALAGAAVGASACAARMLT